jgi:hypothetical protein
MARARITPGRQPLLKGGVIHLPSAVHQQVGDRSTAQVALGVVQQGIVGSSAFGFAARLDRSGVGEGFASTTDAVAIAAL